ncbi:MAG: hypothetical protein ABI072_04885 [Edaphobacter sp.]
MGSVEEENNGKDSNGKNNGKDSNGKNNGKDSNGKNNGNGIAVMQGKFSLWARRTGSLNRAPVVRNRWNLKRL